MNKPAAIKVPHVADVIRVGDAVALVLPPEVLGLLGVEAGDKVDVVEAADGLSLRQHDVGSAKQMRIAREVMERRRAALAELAK